MNFYHHLESFDNFSELTQDRHFARVPDDWLVVIADIRGSTLAIEEGRYRDVNTVGAAAIVALHNLMGEEQFPFVFGGDGATLVIPPTRLGEVKRQLAALRLLAAEQFQLTLRVGAVPVSLLGESRVEVAKFRIAGKRSLAVFRGGGLSRAEELIKQAGEPHDFTRGVQAKAAEADLGGLSCRWLPITPSRDHALSLIVSARNDSEVYNEVLDGISRLYDGNIEFASPINLGGARYRSIGQCLADEKRYHRSPWNLKFAWRCFEIVCAVLIFKYGVPGPFNARKYALSLGRHSDYRKFDDMLRMVIDCSSAQAEEIRILLESLHQDGRIDYGMHLAEEALMTCFFQGAGEGKHLHFIDGADGGYVMAAKQLKNQKAAR